MATKIITKTGSGAPTTSDVDRGELAVDLTNKQLYTNDGTDIIKLGSGSGEGQWSLASNGDDIYYNDGSVGIGTDDPMSSLHIKRAGTSGNPSTLIVQRDPGPGGIDGHAVEIRLAPTQYPNDIGMTARWSGIRAINRGSGNATELAFLTNAPSADPVERMRIDDSGNVGIGTESPAQKLEVHSDGTTQVRIIGGDTGGAILNFGYTARPADGRIVYDNATKMMQFRTNNGAYSFNIDDSGNVGIGTDNPTPAVGNGATLHLYGASTTQELRLERGNGSDLSILAGSTQSEIRTNNATRLLFSTNDTEAMRIDSSGRVGIGGEPGTRTAGEYLEQAKTKIASWKSTFDDRLKAEPKADKKALTLEVTDDAFEVIPTEDLVAEWMAERAIGGGNAKLQVAGRVSCEQVHGNGSASTGLHFGTDSIRPYDGATGAISNGTIDLGQGITANFRNAYFSGAVYVNGSPLTRTSDLIETLSTLREATQDETTLEGLRDSIGNAIGGLIEKFEAKVIQGSS